MQHPERKGRRLIASYFFTYFVVLMIPLLAAGFVSAEFSATLRKHIEQENLALLNRAAEMLDAESGTPDAFAAWIADHPAAAELREKEEIAWIEAADGRVLAATSDDPRMVEALQALLAGTDQHKGTARGRALGKDMLAARCRSAETGVGIGFARSAATAFAPLRKAHAIIMISLFIALALGALFSFLYAAHISALVFRVAADSGTEVEGMNYREAFLSLRKSFEELRSANDTMARTLESQQMVLQQAFLTQLINGEFSDEENALAIARTIPSFHPERPMRVVLLHFAGESGKPGDSPDPQLSAKYKSVIRQSIDALEKGALYVSRSENDDVLLLCGGQTEERGEKLAGLIRSSLPEEVSELLFVCAGNPVEKLTDVARSWESASSMIDLQPPPAEVSVHSYPESEKPQQSVFYPQDMQRRLINSVMNGDDQETLEILRDVKENNRQGGDIPAHILQLLIDNLLSTLLQINTLSGLPQDRTEAILGSAKSLMTLPVSAQLDMVDMLYASLCGEIRKMKGEGGKQQIIDEISAFIQEHYMDADLSLAKVADRFHVSESYLSFTFKAQKGTNFFSFVEGLRINRAKELLRQTSLKISDIAEQVGYASANSFCRAFKRSTGESASNYRNGTEESGA